MPTCKTCKWWGDSTPPEPKRDYSTAQCTHDLLSPDQYPLPRNGAVDSEGYGGIFTGPDFGCVHWGTKDA